MCEVIIMTIRMLLDAHSSASRRTAKRAVVRLLHQTGSWMFDPKDFNGKWE